MGRTLTVKVDRYFTRGLVDGSLATLGVVIGASMADPSIVITAGIGGGVANGLSNAFGALTAESAEVERRFSDIEKSMLSKGELRKTILYKSMRKKVLLSGFSDGIASITGAFIPVLPFLLTYVLKYSNQVALIISILLTISTLFILGMYLGFISRKNLIYSGLKMASIGTVTAIVCTLIEHVLQIRLG